MKRLFIYTVLLLGATMWSCGEEKLNSESVFKDPVVRDSDFDRYLNREFFLPYNVEFKYWLDDKSSSQDFMLTPAKLESSKIMAVLLKHLWIDAYVESSTQGVNFMRETITHEIQLVGSGKYNVSSVVLGEAAGGKVMTLYLINTLDPTDAATYAPERMLQDKGYLQTIQHEFAHILHQTKNYPESFQPISAADYVGETGWETLSETEALNKGFISTYSSKAVDEDFVEILSLYITMTQTAWNARVARASSDGRTKIAQKLEIVQDYMLASWGINITQLRNTILRRANEIPQLEIVNLK
ncbi:MAG: putative zinc-binding metallopeptidase [Alistipes sp.]|jgi:substrate import-associated zinc metallohydrolase lipoprotein|nr:putative zinc-binding metallopeptidase [Alistipes sp.]